jgi:CubicO group peptidase (beta-lactamase class C family)
MAEVLGGESWEALVEREIFRPLGMNASTFVTTADNTKVNIAQGYDVIEDGYDVTSGETLIKTPYELSR